jgi:predicted ATPase/DNA-binding CsgD family transcriptional regulator
MEQGVHGDAGEELNAFIGRERELGELRLLAPGARALTLCGSGGIGKTRLALHLVAGLAASFPDGAWFVELADLRQPELVAARIASVIGVIEEPGRPLIATLADALRPRRALIALDNCEHLIDACAVASQLLLASAPGLQVITTSREPLRVAAETVWQVPPLSLPSPCSGDEAEIAQSDALRLFADRAGAAKPGFAIGPANVAAVAAICRAVDGVPLAIELAAAWVRVLSVEQIAARLADRFRLLHTAERTAPPRHRTLRAAIDWSHDLLTSPEQVLFRRLSVFASWPLEMAEQVCGGQFAGGDLAVRDILDLLTALADKSLVLPEPDARGQIRYRMLDTIRDYAAERLAEANEPDQVHAKFHDYVVREVERLAAIGMALVPASWSARVDVFRRFEAEIGNLRQALTYCVANGDAETGLRICVAMRPVWIVQGSFAEGAGWIDGLLSLGTSGLPDNVLGAALVGRAQLALATDPAEAGRHAKAGLELCRADGSEFWAASALNLLAEVALHAGQAAEAAAHADAAIAVASGAGDWFNVGYASGTLGTLAAYRGDLAEARRLGETALQIARDIDQQWGAARALLGLGDLARLTEDYAAARPHYAAALDILREVSARPEMARCLAGLGRIAISQAEYDVARSYFSESVQLSRSTGSRIGVIRGLDSFAALATAQGNPALAVQLAAAAAALREAATLPEAPATRTKRTLDGAAELGQDAVEELWRAGSALSSDAAVALALAESDRSSSPSGPSTSRSHSAAASPGDPGGQPQPAGGLTAREREIVGCVVRGLRNSAIADELGISPATVARHVANIMRKLGVSSRHQIAAWAAGQAATDGRTGR